MSIDIYEKIEKDSIDLDIFESSIGKKALIISQNSSEIYLVDKLLNQIENFKLYESASLNGALKILNYVEIDIIIIDDKLSNIDGYEIAKRLDRDQIFKNISKLLLLTHDYKSTIYENEAFDNLDFIKKPIDSVIFKSRIRSILKGRKDKSSCSSPFENMIDTKIGEAKEFLKIYKSFLDIDQNILFIYDKRFNKVVEYNRNFTKFFGEYRVFNRVISSPKILKKFVPNMSDPNYLNSHSIDTWIDLVTGVKDFNFIVTIKRGEKEYSFTILADKMKLFGREIYIVKLSNHNLYISNQRALNSIKKREIDRAIFQLQDTLSQIDESVEKKRLKSSIIDLLKELGVESTYFKKGYRDGIELINIYEVVANILKSRSDSIKSIINSKEVTDSFNESGEVIAIHSSKKAIVELFSIILDNYHDGKDLRVDVELYRVRDSVKLVIVTTDIGKRDSSNGIIDKILNINSDHLKNGISNNVISKQLQDRLTLLRADIKTSFREGKNIFTIVLPIYSS